MSADPTRVPARSGPFHVMAKPAGPLCNLACRYCFYLEKRALFAANAPLRMADDVLETFIARSIAGQDAPEIHFGWQGGEPTLLGVDYFARIVELQRRHGDGRPIRNAIQTNGVLLDDAWCRFFAEHGFLVGISIDGPAALHDRHRVDRHRRPTHARVVAAIERLAAHAVDFNTLTVVGRVNGSHPAAVYDHLAALGATFMQFIPLVERRPPRRTRRDPSDDALAGPPDLARGMPGRVGVTGWSVRPNQYGAFLNGVFDRWLQDGIGRIHVQAFETLVGQWLGRPADVCVFAETCGRALALEHDGSVYACDHYVYPAYRRGNLREDDLAALVDGAAQRRFGALKAEALPGQCRRCAVRRLCNGGCPKHRFLRDADGAPGLNYLCAGYRAFFEHTAPAMRRIAAALAGGRPAAEGLAN